MNPASAVLPFLPFHVGAVRFLRPKEPAASAMPETFRRGDILSSAPD
jgi:hypothetical protein